MRLPSSSEQPDKIFKQGNINPKKTTGTCCKASSSSGSAGAVAPDAGAVAPEVGAVAPEVGAVAPEVGTRGPGAAGISSTSPVLLFHQNRPTDEIMATQGWASDGSCWLTKANACSAEVANARTSTAVDAGNVARNKRSSAPLSCNPKAGPASAAQKVSDGCGEEVEAGAQRRISDDAALNIIMTDQEAGAGGVQRGEVAPDCFRD
jgi:hypothetical protein